MELRVGWALIERCFVVLLAMVVGVLGCGFGGCGFAGIGGGLGGGGGLRVVSQSDGGVLLPEVRTSVYRSSDRNTADLLLSDLDRESLLGLGVTETSPEGVVVHVHLFLLPSAGRTPIDATASNVTTTVYVFAGDAAGVYRGGGFLFADGEPGGRAFGGRLASSDLRLSRASAFFADVLGNSTMSGRVRGERDVDLVGTLLDRLALLSSEIPRVVEDGGP